MEQYTKAAYAASRIVTDAYSTSFSLSIRLFDTSLRPHIYAIYGLVRIADEIVDTYRKDDSMDLLDGLEQETYRALVSGYSTNPIVQAFAATARRYSITKDLIEPFFSSMRTDLTPQTYDKKKYDTYIHGSAEVVGLMCLKVFVGDAPTYRKLATGARRLGAAYQKINFLRDLAADADDLGRWYFPVGSYKSFDEKQKQAIIADISDDLRVGRAAIDELPKSCRRAVLLSYKYYRTLLDKIENTPAEKLKQQRIRIPDVQKIALLTGVAVRGR